MNRVEKFVYDKFKSRPWLKYLIRNIYQTFFDLLPKKKEFSINPIEFREGYFFGFHDKSPFSEDGKKILTNHVEIPLRMPFAEDKLEVGYFEFNNGFKDFKKNGESYAWNYHKGCRLQWLDKEKIIYNTVKNSKLCSVIVHVVLNEEYTLSNPIDTVSKDGKFATSFSYERLNAFMPGYGYEYGHNNDSYLDINAPEETGIFLIDLISDEKKLLVSLSELSMLPFNGNTLDKYKHFVTHSEFSIDGRYISFLHRWVGEDILKLNTRLIIYDTLKKSVSSLPTNGMVSHYVWNKRNEIIAYCNINDTDAHVLFKIEDNQVNHKLIKNELLNSDGHQCFVNDDLFITDTYPDKNRMAFLYLVNSSNHSVKTIAKIYSPRKFQTRNPLKNIACDLHPRVSPKSDYVCFDSVSSGHRSLCVMSLK